MGRKDKIPRNNRQRCLTSCYYQYIVGFYKIVVQINQNLMHIAAIVQKILPITKLKQKHLRQTR
ncbi:hypothetical protein BKI52_24990 [marine bacterium AO1-C]|nr:hypothetical protein BKI52_24990 [marine bacterium AO1-C]